MVNAIAKAEEELAKGEVLYCLFGDIVHNSQEVKRLKDLGLIIDYEQFQQLHDVKVMFRAHGEPPSTYETARKNNITLIDAPARWSLNFQSRHQNSVRKEKRHRISTLQKKGMLK